MSNPWLQLGSKQNTLPSSTTYGVCTRSVMLSAYNVAPHMGLLSQSHKWGQYVASPKLPR